jgi:hypothetical protein
MGPNTLSSGIIVTVVPVFLVLTSSSFWSIRTPLEKVNVLFIPSLVDVTINFSDNAFAHVVDYSYMSVTSYTVLL